MEPKQTGNGRISSFPFCFLYETLKLIFSKQRKVVSWRFDITTVEMSTILVKHVISYILLMVDDLTVTIVGQAHQCCMKITVVQVQPLHCCGLCWSRVCIYCSYNCSVKGAMVRI